MKKRIVLISNLYPNPNEKNRGVFIRQLAERLTHEFDLTVVCPIPWKPKFLRQPAQEVPKVDTVNGVQVLYPRHIVIPKMMRFSYGWLMYLALLPVLKNLHKQNMVDLISAHWIYPDGFAAMQVAKKLNIPVVVHALGCDINEYSKYWSRKIQIAKALMNSDRVVVKSRDLATKSQQLGADPENIHTIMNGVDKDKFYPRDMSDMRAELGLDADGKYLLFVGNLQVEKGLIYLLTAVAKIKDYPFKLLVVGDGPQSSQMKEVAIKLGISAKVEFLGAINHPDVPRYLSAVDALCLSSLREGCPNIVLESLSCGTPVLASNVGAVPDMITSADKGIIIEAENAQQIADNIPSVLTIKTNQEVQFSWYSWDENAQKIGQVFKELIH